MCVTIRKDAKLTVLPSQCGNTVISCCLSCFPSLLRMHSDTILFCKTLATDINNMRKGHCSSKHFEETCRIRQEISQHLRSFALSSRCCWVNSATWSDPKLTFWAPVGVKFQNAENINVVSAVKSIVWSMMWSFVTKNWHTSHTSVCPSWSSLWYIISKHMLVSQSVTAMDTQSLRRYQPRQSQKTIAGHCQENLWTPWSVSWVLSLYGDIHCDAVFPSKVTFSASSGSHCVTATNTQGIGYEGEKTILATRIPSTIVSHVSFSHVL